MRVITWNLWWRFGPWEERQPAIAAELVAAAPDIVLLQEVWHHDGVDQAQTLAEALGMHLARTTGADGSPHRFGNAILSRWPLTDAVTTPLPGSDGRDGHRSLLTAATVTPRGRQPVATTHLDWRYDGSSTRQRQLDVVCSTLGAPHVDEEALPIIFGGDLNAVPDSDEVRRLTGRGTPYVDGLVFTDAWAASSDEPGYTWVRDNPHAADAQWPRRRLDYVFVAWPRQRPQGNPLSARLAGLVDGPGHREHGIVPSDHYAVLAEFDTRAPFPKPDGP